MRVREVLRLLHDDGWFLVRTRAVIDSSNMAASQGVSLWLAPIRTTLLPARWIVSWSRRGWRRT